MAARGVHMRFLTATGPYGEVYGRLLPLSGGTRSWEEKGYEEVELQTHEIDKDKL